MPTIIVIDQQNLQAFTHPGIDLDTGLVIELDPLADPAPVQLELFSADVQGGHDAAHCRNHLT
ncbi:MULTISPECIES: hypothetical protein [unclassified Pseudomonas]|uniref:Uncharacterized protein n=1 Tax=Pseudomonas sp. 13.2 TaxID=3144665 RepID=A0AAU7BEQ8_9PSED|nr:hypothetical protein [Pseudomonas sp. SWI36]